MQKSLWICNMIIFQKYLLKKKKKKEKRKRNNLSKKKNFDHLWCSYLNKTRQNKKQTNVQEKSEKSNMKIKSSKVIKVLVDNENWFFCNITQKNRYKY